MGLAYFTPRAEFGQLLALFGMALLAYAWLLRSQLPWRWGLAATLVFRLLWLPATPAFSDDVYRFRWDGLLVANGVNPFQFRPDEIIADGARTALSPEAGWLESVTGTRCRISLWTKGAHEAAAPSDAACTSTGPVC